MERPGLTPAQERRFNAGAGVVLVLFAVGWGLAIATSVARGEAPRITERLTANPLAPEAAPEAAFLVDAALRQLLESRLYRGESGAVNVLVQEEGEELPIPRALDGEVGVEYEVADAPGAPAAEAPGGPGIWNVIVGMKGLRRPVPDLLVVRPVPIAERRGGRIGQYLVGEWPFERGGQPKTPAYAPPKGLIMVTQENQNLQVSRHFRLRDFLTKGQEGVWPKYVLMSPRLLDKLELTIQELELMGHPVENVGIISGFRHPHYNARGGSTAGRGALSRHMYGDAMDFYIDNDRDGRMDDLNGDGRIDVRDARIIAEAAERVERKYPQLIGGIGVYRPTGAHSGFVHVDTRGYRARW
jgi:uncharacterized protein YcbK (DUF882 family)